MKKYRTLNYYQGPLKFAAGHFTIFSATHRETLHGHNYALEASVTAAIGEPGITFDYNIFREKLVSLCKMLDKRFLLPANSPYLKIEEDENYYYAIFNTKKLPFLKEDVLILPVTNVTIEELSQWFVEQIITDTAFIHQYAIQKIVIKVFNGPEQSASAEWFVSQSEIPSEVPIETRLHSEIS